MNRQHWLVLGSPVLSSALLLIALTGTGFAEAAARSGRDSLPDTLLGPYVTDPEPMTTVECGRCHRQHFNTLKHEGGRTPLLLHGLSRSTRRR